MGPSGPRGSETRPQPRALRRSNCGLWLGAGSRGLLGGQADDPRGPFVLRAAPVLDVAGPWTPPATRSAAGSCSLCTAAAATNRCFPFGHPGLLFGAAPSRFSALLVAPATAPGSRLLLVS